MTSISTPLRIAIGFIIALWVVGLIALAVDAPGEIVVATAAIGTVGALVEWSSHRPESHDAALTDTAARTEHAATDTHGQQAPHPLVRRPH